MAQEQETDAATHQRLLKKVFHEYVDLDPAMVTRVLSTTTGTITYLPKGEGRKHAETWFIDPDLRNPAKFRPVLVRAIDEDDDLQPDALPDNDSDLYIADWNADGIADVVIDYTDTDGDQDLDEMGMYFVGSSHSYFGEPVLRVWWARDTGDDNLLIRDVAYHYIQSLCQWRSHFGGNETILAFAITEDGKEWVPFWENPFEFYDHDGDHASEEVLRLSGIDTDVEAYRHSFDVDNDTTAERMHDYDVSVTAWASGARWTSANSKPGLSNLKMRPELTQTMELRGFSTRPFVRHDRAREFCEDVVWERSMLTWDENDNNIDNQNREALNERWEGIIAAGNPDFMQVGGPNTGLFNKRYELDMKPDQPVGLYYHPADHKLHLLGAERGWIEVDYDYNQQADFRYEFTDTDNDGKMDKWTFDENMDGRPDDEWTSSEPATNLPYKFDQLNKFFMEKTARLNEDYFNLAQTLKTFASANGAAAFAEQAWNQMLAQFSPDVAGFEIAQKLANSDQAIRFHLEVFNDRLLSHLRAAQPEAKFWPELARARSKGDTSAMAVLFSNTSAQPANDTYERFRTQLVPEHVAPRVAWDDKWLPPNVAWESNKSAYRSYYGQFDFFGKAQPQLVLNQFDSTNTYHQETEWGMDALLVGNSPGCGGLTLYVNDRPYPAWSKEGKGPQSFSHELISQSRDEIVIRVTISNVGPPEASYKLQLDCQAIADRHDTPITAMILGGPTDAKLRLGVGLTRLPQQTLLEDPKNRILGVWGAQSLLIGYIGMGVILPPNREIEFKSLENEQQAIFPVQTGEPVSYSIECDWLRGLRYTRSPGASEWFARLATTAEKHRITQ